MISILNTQAQNLFTLPIVLYNFYIVQNQLNLFPLSTTEGQKLTALQSQSQWKFEFSFLLRLNRLPHTKLKKVGIEHKYTHFGE